MATEPVPSASAVGRDLDALLEESQSPNGPVFVLILWILGSLVALLYGFFHFGGESFWSNLLLSFASWVGVCMVSFLALGMWIERVQAKSVRGFNRHFPEGQPERAIAMQALEARAKHNTDARTLYAALGGVESLAKADDKPADGKMQDALAQLGPPPAASDSVPASVPAAPPGLDHIPLEPDDLRPLEGAKGRPPC